MHLMLAMLLVGTGLWSAPTRAENGHCATCPGANASPFEDLEAQMDDIRKAAETPASARLVRETPREVRPGILEFQFEVNGERHAILVELEADAQSRDAAGRIKSVRFADAARAERQGLSLDGDRIRWKNADLASVQTQQPGWLSRQPQPGQRILEFKVRTTTESPAATAARFQYGVGAGRVSYLQRREESYGQWSQDYSYQPVASSREDEWLLHFNLPIIGELLNLDGKKREALFEEISKTLRTSLPGMGLNLSESELQAKAWEITQYATRADVIGPGFRGGKPAIELAASVYSYWIFGDMKLSQELRTLVPAGTSNAEVQGLVNELTRDFKSCLTHALQDTQHVNKRNADACLELFTHKVPVETGRRVLELQVKTQARDGVLKGLNGQQLSAEAARAYAACIEDKFINHLPRQYKLEYGYQIIQACTFRALSETLIANLGEVLKTQIQSRAATSPMLAKIKLDRPLIQSAQVAARNCLGRRGFVVRDRAGHDEAFEETLGLTQEQFLAIAKGTCLDEITGVVGESVVRAELETRLKGLPFDSVIQNTLADDAIQNGYRPCAEALLKQAAERPESMAFNPERCGPMIQTRLLKSALGRLLTKELGSTACVVTASSPQPCEPEDCFDNHMKRMQGDLGLLGSSQMSDTQFKAYQVESDRTDVACVKSSIRDAAVSIGKNKVLETLSKLSDPAPEIPVADLQFIGEKLGECVARRLQSVETLDALVGVRFETFKAGCLKELAGDAEVRRRAFSPLVRAQLKDLKVSPEREEKLITTLLSELQGKIQNVIERAVVTGETLGPKVLDELNDDAVRVMSKALAKEEASDLIQDQQFQDALGLMSEAEREAFRETFANQFRDTLMNCRTGAKALSEAPLGSQKLFRNLDPKAILKECVLRSKVSVTKWVGEQVLMKELSKPEHDDMFTDEKGKLDPELRKSFAKSILNGLDQDIVNHFRTTADVTDGRKVRDSFQMLVSRLSTEAVRAIVTRSAEVAWKSVLPEDKNPGVTQERTRELKSAKPELDSCLESVHKTHRRAILRAEAFDHKLEMAPCVNAYQIRAGLSLARAAVERRFPILMESKVPNTIVADYKNRALDCSKALKLKQDPAVFGDQWEACLAEAAFPTARALVRFRRDIPEFNDFFAFQDATEARAEACVAKIEFEWKSRKRDSKPFVKLLADAARAHAPPPEPATLDWLLKHLEECAESPLVPDLVTEVREKIVALIDAAGVRGSYASQDVESAKDFVKSMFARNEKLLDGIVRGRIGVTHVKKPGKGVPAVEFLLSHRLPDLMRELSGYRGEAAEWFVDLARFNRGHEAELKAEYSDLIGAIEERIRKNGDTIDVDEIVDLVVGSKLVDRLSKFSIAHMIREQVKPLQADLELSNARLDQATSLAMMERLFGPEAAGRGRVRHSWGRKLLDDNWKDIEEELQADWNSEQQRKYDEETRLLAERDRLEKRLTQMNGELDQGPHDVRWQRDLTVLNENLSRVRQELRERDRDEDKPARDFRRAGGTTQDLRNARKALADRLDNGFHAQNGFDVLQTFKKLRAPDLLKRILRGEKPSDLDKSVLEALKTQVMDVLGTDVDMPNGRGERGQQDGLVFTLVQDKLKNDLNYAMDNDQGILDPVVKDKWFYLENVIKENGGIVALDGVAIKIQNQLKAAADPVNRTQEEIRRRKVLDLYLDRFIAKAIKDAVL